MATEKTTEKLPPLKLIGTDGNAFAVLGRMKQAAEKAGWPKEKTKAVLDEAKAGDYDHLLGTAMKHFDVT